MLDDWANSVDSNNSARALFVDYTKAFDRIDHTLLLNKFQSYEVSNTIIKWLFSFLWQRHQRVKIKDTYSEWILLKAGFPQGTWLGPLAFVTLINDLSLPCSVHKFIDDTTLSETLTPSSTSNMVSITEQLSQWSSRNYMVINHNKTKEILFGSINYSNPPPPLNIDGHSVERVNTFKLLGIYISGDFRWDAQIDALCQKVNTKLYFLKQLKRAGLSPNDLLCFYSTAIRPVLEYACVVWHHGLTKTQSDRLEALQKRAVRIIWGDIIKGMPYQLALSLCHLDSLYERRIKISRSFFEAICSVDSCIHHLLPPKRDQSILARLRSASTYPIPLVKTNRYCSFVNYALLHYQKK